MLSYKVEGLDRLVKKASQELLTKPVREFFTSAAIVVQGKARQKAPVDTGQLRNDILYMVDGAELPLWARVGILSAREGSSLWYKARAMEFGTGTQGDPEVSHSSRHWPPGNALGTWASRHGGMGGFAVAAAIGKRGGLRPRRYLRDALKESKADIAHLLEALREAVRTQWEKR